jgi:hypothetical protein
MPEKPTDDQVREEQIRRIMERVEAKLRKKLGTGQQTVDDMEEVAVDVGDAVKEVIVDEVQKDCGSGYAGSRSVCSCGARAKYKRTQDRRVITCAGIVTFERAYYYCASCRRGWCPADFVLGLTAHGECSRRVRSLVARFSCYLPFRLVAEEMEAICGVRLAPSTIERIAQEVGTRVADDWARKERLVAQRRALPSNRRPSRLHATMDGVIIHVGGEWREAKLACVYQTSSRGCQSGHVTHAAYLATLARSDRFGRLVRTLAHHEGADRCANLAVVADGGAWIWQETGKYFASKVQILDFYHATENLWKVARAWFGEGSEQACQWMSEQKKRLLEDHVDQVIAELANWKPRRSDKQKIKRNVLEYLRTHRHRMAYKSLAADGWHIGSGVIEAGCKYVVKARMGGAGMRWKEPGAEAMLHLCAAWRSSGPTDFYKYAQ